MPESPDTLYFLHLPKTAGTSVTEWLQRQYPAEQCCPCVSMPEISRLDRPALNDYRLFAGHMGWDLVELLPVPPVIVSWFRDPVERVVSSYWYLRKLPDAERAALVHARARRQAERAAVLTLEEWIELPAEEYGIHNHMTWTLAGGRTDRRTPLESALRHLLRLDVIGMVDRMDASLALVTARMGWLPSLQGGRRKESTKLAPNQNAGLNARIEQLNWMDRAVYQTAGSLFRERCGELALALGFDGQARGGESGREEQPKNPIDLVDAYTLFFAQEWHRLQKPWTGPRLREGHVSAAEPFFRTGWFPAVPCPEATGRSIRWTSDKVAARIYLPLETDTDLQLRFIIGRVADRSLLGVLGIMVNNVDCPHTVLPFPDAAFPDAIQILVPVSQAILQMSPHLTRVNFKDTRFQRVPYAYQFLSFEDDIRRGLGVLGLTIARRAGS